MVALVDFVFVNMALATSVVGLLVNYLEDKLPTFITRTFRYGKFSADDSKSKNGFDWIRSSQVPKSYFRHFYVAATIMSFAALITALRLYFFGTSIPNWFIKFLDFWCGQNRKSMVSMTTTIIVLSLITLQCIKRFYETFYIQVFADNAKMSIAHYLVGHFHYFGCIIVILGQSVGFTKEESTISHIIDIQTSVFAVPTIGIFMFAWLNQFKSNVILANLRKDSSSKKVISQKYFLPQSGWFKYVSSPHQLCEIMLYLSLTLLLFKNVSWLFVVFWVLSNQVETALLSHWWYQKTFPKMPKERKALIPFIF